MLDFTHLYKAFPLLDREEGVGKMEKGFRKGIRRLEGEQGD